MADERPTDADVTEARAILQDYAKIRREGTSEEVKMINPQDESMAKAVLASAKELGVRPTVVPKKNKNKPNPLYDYEPPKKNKGGPITKPKAKMMGGGMYGGGEYKKPQMVHGGVHKGKKHAYAAGGMVKDINMMRNK